MASILTMLVLFGLAFLSAESLPIARPVVDDGDNSPIMFYGNVSYTLEDILEELQNTTNLGDNANTALTTERLARSTSDCGSGCFSTGAYGGQGGQAFSDHTINGHTCPNIAAIREIFIQTATHIYNNVGEVIKSLQILYEYTNGHVQWGPLQGSLRTSAGSLTCPGDNSRTEHRIYLACGERIQTIVGRADGLRLRQLAFITNNPSGTRNIHGPYGSNTLGNLFIINANVVSFYGRSGCHIDSIGFFYQRCSIC